MSTALEGAILADTVPKRGLRLFDDLGILNRTSEKGVCSSSYSEIEFGQLLFVGGILTVVTAIRRIFTMPKQAVVVSAYAVGI